MAESISRKSFMRLGAVIGVGAAGSSLLASCGGSSGSSGSGSSGGSSSSSASSGSGSSSSQATSSSASASSASGSATSSSSASGQAMSGAIAKVSDVAPGSAKAFKDSGKAAVLVHLDDGSFAAYSAICTHQGCTVAYKNGQLACPCHGSIFDPANGGEVVNGPAQSPLPEIPVKVQDGSVVKS